MCWVQLQYLEEAQRFLLTWCHQMSISFSLSGLVFGLSEVSCVGDHWRSISLTRGGMGDYLWHKFLYLWRIKQDGENVYCTLLFPRLSSTFWCRKHGSYRGIDECSEQLLAEGPTRKLRYEPGHLRSRSKKGNHECKTPLWSADTPPRSQQNR